jgi:transcriptional regulator with XRE-family HTH domain
MNSLRIKELRKKLGLTQDDLAKKIGVSRKTIVNYENGEVIPETKRELLDNILNQKENYLVEEPRAEYPSFLSRYDNDSVEDLIKKLDAKEQIIKILLEKIDLLSNQKPIISLQNKK